MREWIQRIFLTSMVAVLITSLTGCFYYRRVDYDERYRRDRYEAVR